MTTITIYPLFSNNVNILNLSLYASNNGLTVVSYSDVIINSNGQKFCSLQVSQTLTLQQQQAIQNIFQGTAYIIFT